MCRSPTGDTRLTDRRTPAFRSGRGAQLRADIAHAATQLVATDGAQGLTLRAVARKAGITAPSIYLHFPVLAEILEALADTSFVMLADYMRRAGERCNDPVSRLPAACHAYVAFGQQYPNEYAIMFTHQTDLVRAGSAESVETVRGAQAFELVLEPLRACIDDSVSGSTELEADATALLGRPSWPHQPEHVDAIFPVAAGHQGGRYPHRS